MIGIGHPINHSSKPLNIYGSSLTRKIHEAGLGAQTAGAWRVTVTSITRLPPAPGSAYPRIPLPRTSYALSQTAHALVSSGVQFTTSGAAWLDIGGSGETQRCSADAALDARLDDASQHGGGVRPVMGVQHRRIAAAEHRHAHGPGDISNSSVISPRPGPKFSARAPVDQTTSTVRASRLPETGVVVTARATMIAGAASDAGLPASGSIRSVMSNLSWRRAGAGLCQRCGAAC